MKHGLKKLLLAFGLMAFCATPFAVFDPVNDDTDLFRNNPNIPSERPNVLIILDNTANWNTAFTNEKSALVSVVNSLDSAFNVGLMLFPETGGGNDSIDGGYVKFAMRQMISANKTALASIVGALDINADKGNNSTIGLAMHEAYLYFGGRTNRASFGKVKTDFTGNTANNPLAAALGNSALPASPGASSLYSSAMSDACQKNYIIFISNGPTNENASARTTGEALLTAARGGSAPPVIAITPNGQQANWADEYAKFMAENDINSTLTGSQTAITYVVEVDPGSTGQAPAMTALAKSMAQNGKGKYFAVTSGGTGQAIVDALNSIFSEIQAVNSVFAAATLPVSVNVRGTNLNQIYIGVFRPDAGDKPRWLGNLKAYQLQKDTTTGEVRTVDVNLQPVVNSSTGFITGSAVSFWTSATLSPTDYWSFRPAAANGIGGSSDSPDGDLVEKGGAGQQVRSLYFQNGVNGTPTRPLYTCTQGSPSCTVGSLLSATPFNVANAAIDAASLNLDTKQVSPLTAAVVLPVTALVDSRSVTLNNSVAPINVSSITTNTTTKSVSALSNTRSISVTALSNGAVNKTVALTRPSNGLAQGVVSAGHGLGASQQVLVTTGTAPAYGGTRYDTSSASATVTIINSTTFTYPISNGTQSATTGTLVTSNTTVNGTAAAHGFVTGESVTIAGATPTSFNGAKTIAVLDANTFSYANSVAFGPTLSSATATGATTTVTATSTAHGFIAGQTITIAGASPAGFSGSYTILSSPAVTANTFAYQTATTITTAATGTISANFSGTTATAAVTAHGFTNGQSITISGASPAGFNGTFTISGVTANTFDYTVSSGLGNASASPLIQAAAGTGPGVTATLTSHGFGAGNSVTITGAATVGFNGAFTVLTVPDANTFTFSTGATLAAAGGSPIARLTSNPNAYATIASHAYGANGASVSNFTLSGATPAGYNVSNATVTVVDANTVTYTLTAALGASSGTILATTPGTAAIATSTAHGFITSASVVIGGAAPSAFNGTYTITVLDADRFTYTLASAQKTATGTITAISSGSGASERTNVINWVRGEDNFEDENANSSFADTRTTIHGDVLHSRPAVINYNRRTDAGNIDNDVYVFYGGNDGVFRAVKGGFGSSSGDPAPGTEVWGFVAKEHFPYLRRLRINSPAISSSNKKQYFFDGSIGTYVVDANGDGKIDVSGTPNPASTTQDQAWLFLTVRRGGRFIYALDVSQPLSPRLLWRKGCPSLETNPALIDAASGCDLGWGELGQTWSEPKVVSINASTDPVLMFGAGYDPLVEDLDPAAITSSNASSVVASSTTYTRSMGRGIYVVNARTGAIIWQASGHAQADSSPHQYLQVTGMDFAIPSDVAVVVGDSTPKPVRAYVGDTGGQMWRLDFGDVSPANWRVAKLASIADQTTSAGRRKFLFAPEVIGAGGFDAVISGTGDREHPFDTVVTNSVYAFKDKRAPPLLAVVANVQQQATITHATTAAFNGSTVSTLLSVTTNCIQVAANCSGTAPELAVGGSTASQNTAAALADTANTGWFITLAAGEKQVGGTLAPGGGAFVFGTNQPSASAGGGACSPNLGVARGYTVNFLNGTAFTGTSLSETYAGGGFLPSPVLVYVALGGASGTGTVSSGGVSVGGNVSGGQIKVGAGAGIASDVVAVQIAGINAKLAPGEKFFARLRKFWYKEID